MKNKFAFAFILIPFLLTAQIKVKDLPTTTTGSSGDFILKDDVAGTPGSTKKISISDFKSVYFPTLPTYSLSATAPLTYSLGVFDMPKSTLFVDGYLSATDFTTFWNKQNALSVSPRMAYTSSLSFLDINKDSVPTIFYLLHNYIKIGANSGSPNITGLGSVSGGNATFVGSNVFSTATKLIGRGGIDGMWSDNMLTVASASTLSLSADNGANTYSVTGTTNIDSVIIANVYPNNTGTTVKLIFTNTLTLNNSATFTLQGSSNITTAAGDVMTIVHLGGNKVKGYGYSRASGVALVATSAATTSITAGSGITVSGTAPSYTVTNSAPNQTVTIGSGTGVSVAGTYPTFTVSSTGVATGICAIYNTSGVPTYYSTLRSAITAASSGQTIFVFANITESTAIIKLKNGVTINLQGTRYTYTGTGGSPFTDSATAPTCYMYNGTIITTNYTGYAFTNSGTTYTSGLTITASASGGSAAFVGNIYNGTYNGASGGVSYGVDATGIVQGVTATGFYGINTSTTTSLIKDCLVPSSTGRGVLYSGLCINTTAYNTAFSCFDAQTNGATAINCTAISTTAGINGWFNGAANCTLQNCTVNTVGTAVIGGGGCNIVGGSYISSGAFTISGCSLLQKPTIKCTWNNSGGHGVIAQASMIINNADIAVTNASANCINGGSITLEYNKCLFTGATLPVTATITQGNANAQDLQGNLKY
ncbi:MAG: hypothetical protein V4538_16225 [Bacteroidota bacterium]